ncbi:hypothetical protein [Frigidibacter oleivorans]|uniref:hypothetical protein n=1 Tax=Frigidibacter oleivorans TaxID=2487129 RepID=UPI000F8D5E68|nr:hypothetical protein [Frigidibacter oleivorans]
MLAVVVWSNALRQEAVLWCEDHGPVAYLRGRGALAAAPERPAPRWPAKGALMAVATEQAGGLRLVTRAEPVAGRWAEYLPERLLATAAAAEVQAAANGAAAPARPEADLPPAAAETVSEPERKPWRPERPAFPPAPFAPVPVGQGMMRTPRTQPAEEGGGNLASLQAALAARMARSRGV